ncbi:MAG: hypothetical protein V4507_16035 [Verrucomicrobiota bacterium]
MLKVVIDSTPVQLTPASGSSFSALCEEAMKILLEKNRAISVCKIDGKLVTDPTEVDAVLSSVKLLEIESLPLKEVLLTSIQHHVIDLKRLEQAAEQLVTDCLLAEPQEIVNQWTAICEETKKKLAFVPTLAPILSERQLEEKMDPLFKQLAALMNEAGGSFSTADVVSFSDTIENKFIPWLHQFRAVVQTAQDEVEKYND